jgi:sigma-B regulation protein RsbU (phosphoserine phosphatase)
VIALGFCYQYHTLKSAFTPLEKGMRLWFQEGDSSGLEKVETNYVETSILYKSFYNKIAQIERDHNLLTNLKILQKNALGEESGHIEKVKHHLDEELQHHTAISNLTNSWIKMSPEEMLSQNASDLSILIEPIVKLYMDKEKLLDESNQFLLQEKEFELGTQFQSILVNPGPSDTDTFQASWHYQPAQFFGGDFYDYHNIGDEHYFVIGDVSGKGLGAAMYGLLVKTLLRSYLANNNPEQAIFKLNNQALAQFELTSFCTLFVLCLNENSLDQSWYISAGHNQMMLIQNGDTQLLSGEGLPLGMCENENYECCPLAIKNGDTLLLYSDGIPEAHNPMLEQYGLERMCRFNSRNIKTNANEFCEKLISEVNAFSGTSILNDDQTAITIRLK